MIDILPLDMDRINDLIAAAHSRHEPVIWLDAVNDAAPVTLTAWAASEKIKELTGLGRGGADALWLYLSSVTRAPDVWAVLVRIEHVCVETWTFAEGQEIAGPSLSLRRNVA